MKKLTTMADVLDLLADNRRSSDSILSEYALTLYGARDSSRGSSTMRGLDIIPRDRLVERVSVEHVKEGCDAYMVIAPELGGMMHAITVKEAQDLGLVVRARIGKHGDELFAEDKFEKSPPRRTDEIYLIVGDFSGQDALFTWHPGKPFSPYEIGILPSTGVKIV